MIETIYTVGVSLSDAMNRVMNGSWWYTKQVAVEMLRKEAANVKLYQLIITEVKLDRTQG